MHALTTITGTDSDRDASPAPARRVLLARVAGRAVAFELDRVREVVDLGGVTRLPLAAACVRGVINLRGRIVSVIDLGTRLGFGAAMDTADRPVVVTDYWGTTVGCLVDTVTSITSGPLVDEEPEDVPAVMAEGVVATPDAHAVLLDLDRLLDLRDARGVA